MNVGRRLVVAFLMLAYSPFGATVVHVSATEFYARHIILVPVLAVALLWIDRHHFRQASGRGGFGGPALVVAAVALLLFGYATSSVFLQALSLIGTVAGLALWFYGTGGLLRSAFVLAFLLMMVPPPPSAIGVIAPAMQHAVATFAAAVGETLQIPVEQDGLFLKLPALTLHVAEGCAGLRFALVHFVLVTAFGRLVLRSGWAHAALMLLSIPVVMLANAMRVATITVSSYAFGPHVATGPLHDYIGKLFWLLAVLAMIGFAVQFRSHTAEKTAHSAKIGDRLSSAQR